MMNVDPEVDSLLALESVRASSLRKRLEFFQFFYVKVDTRLGSHLET